MKIFAGGNKIFICIDRNLAIWPNKNLYYTQFQPRKNPSNPSAPCASYWLSALSGWRVWFFNPSRPFNPSAHALNLPTFLFCLHILQQLRRGVKPPPTLQFWRVWKKWTDPILQPFFRWFSVVLDNPLKSWKVFTPPIAYSRLFWLQFRLYGFILFLPIPLIFHNLPHKSPSALLHPLSLPPLTKQKPRFAISIGGIGATKGGGGRTGGGVENN